MKSLISTFVALTVLTTSFLATSESRCPFGAIPCDDGNCIYKKQWCDGSTDCPDQSDEAYCKKTSIWSLFSDPNGCEHTHFLCRNGICFPPVVKCDGINDCESGEDEDSCVEEHATEYSEGYGNRHTTESSLLGSSLHDLESTTESYLGPTSHSTFNSFRREAETPKPINERIDNSQKSPQNLPAVRRRQTPAFDMFDVNRSDRVLRTIESIAKAERWFLHQRRPDWGWRKDTARALIALALANPARFSNFNKDDSLMKKQFQVIMAIDLLRNQSQRVSLSKLSLYINAMLATCQDPHNFHGADLVQELRQRTTAVQATRMRSGVFVNPIVYLTLCNVDLIEPDDVADVQTLLQPISREQKWLDMQALSIMAFSCITRNTVYNSNSYKTKLMDAAREVASRMSPDGSFGNLYSSALAIQALVAANAYDYWSNEPSLTFLRFHQQENGSFGDLLATYYVLPALTRRTLVQLRNVQCNISRDDDGLISFESLKNSREIKHSVHYSFRLGKPEELSHSIMLHVPVNTTFFSIMNFAAQMDPMFRFLYEKDVEEVTVYSINNIPNDAERGKYWNLYVFPNYEASIDAQQVEAQKPYTRGIQHLLPNGGNHVVFWYHSI